MSQGPGFHGSDPYQERLDRYWAWIRGRAWLLALVLTVLGDLVLIALTRKVVPVLAYSPLSFLILLFTFRLSVRYGPWLTGGTQPLKRVRGDPLKLPNDWQQPARNEPIQDQRTRIFGLGVFLFILVCAAAAALWFAGIRGDRRPAVLSWILFGVMAAYAYWLWRSFGPNRVLPRLRKQQASSMMVASRVISSLSWIAVANSIIQAVCGLGLALVSGQVWWFVPFGLLSLGSGFALWLRLGECVAALSIDGGA